ncbi:MAG: hypothetical protein IJT21_00935 [Synergistaceae bacterium]|nr:hypothetical protein [Synergistaceae bacterium]
MEINRRKPVLLPDKIKVAFMCKWARGLESLIKILRINDPEIISRMVIDEKNPDYIIATEGCYVSPKLAKQLKYYLTHCENSIFIFFSGECVDPDLNLFDYANVYNFELQCGDRISRYIDNRIYTLNNNLTRGDARKILENSPKFCNFIYSHGVKARDSFFHMLSEYKRVDSLGSHLNNTGIQSTRHNNDWYQLSIKLKRGYKFSIAMENAAYRGYMTEKIISSLEAHTVPIYWGDPTAADLINPKAFINCADYDSFEEVIERVKEIDNDNEKWLDMVTQPWQTDEQREKTLQISKNHDEFIHNIFYQDIKKARRRPAGMWANLLKNAFAGFLFYICVRHQIGKLFPKRVKPAIKKFLNIP